MQRGSVESSIKGKRRAASALAAAAIAVVVVVVAAAATAALSTIPAPPDLSTACACAGPRYYGHVVLLHLRIWAIRVLSYVVPLPEFFYRDGEHRRRNGSAPWALRPTLACAIEERLSLVTGCMHLISTIGAFFYLIVDVTEGDFDNRRGVDIFFGLLLGAELVLHMLAEGLFDMWQKFHR
jgi:hypothetical protein